MLTKEQLKKEVTVSLSDDIISIVYLFYKGDKEVQIQKATYVYDEIIKMLEANEGKKFKLLVDLSKLEGLKFLPREVRAKYVEMAKDKRLKSAAIVGGNEILKVAVGFIMKTAGREADMKIFGDRQLALYWLKTR